MINFPPDRAAHAGGLKDIKFQIRCPQQLDHVFALTIKRVHDGETPLASRAEAKVRCAPASSQLLCVSGSIAAITSCFRPRSTSAIRFAGRLWTTS